MKRNERGVTLIALVVTIVVLLILAGTAIAMLSGDDGIMTNAQRAQAANTEGEVREKIKLAYSALKTEIDVNSAVDTAYNATSATEIPKLFQLVLDEMGLTTADVNTNILAKSGYIVTYAASGEQIDTDGDNAVDTAVPTIYFEYRDNKFGGSEASNVGDDNKIANPTTTGSQEINGEGLKHIWAYITIEPDNAQLVISAPQLAK